MTVDGGGEETAAAVRVRAILAEVKLLAAEYYRLTGKPLGVTGEVAEYVAAELLGLELAPPRTAGYDAIRRDGEQLERIQVERASLRRGRETESAARDHQAGCGLRLRSARPARQSNARAS